MTLRESLDRIQRAKRVQAQVRAEVLARLEAKQADKRKS